MAVSKADIEATLVEFAIRAKVRKEFVNALLVSREEFGTFANIFEASLMALNPIALSINGIVGTRMRLIFSVSSIRARTLGDWVISKRALPMSKLFGIEKPFL